MSLRFESLHKSKNTSTAYSIGLYFFNSLVTLFLLMIYECAPQRPELQNGIQNRGLSCGFSLFTAVPSTYLSFLPRNIMSQSKSWICENSSFQYCVGLAITSFSSVMVSVMFLFISLEITTSSSNTKQVFSLDDLNSSHTLICDMAHATIHLFILPPGSKNCLDTIPFLISLGILISSPFIASTNEKSNVLNLSMNFSFLSCLSVRLIVYILSIPKFVFFIL